MTDEPAVALFSYGTLQLPDVQRATYGRLLGGRPDTLAGYRLEPLAITSAEVAALSGKAVHTIARRTGKAEDLIEGLVFMLTAGEIEATDRYEVDAYARVEAVLVSGARAFVYVGPDLA
jgi:hypothetical protein